MNAANMTGVENLRPVLHQMIDALEPRALALTHQFIRELELDLEIRSLQEEGAQEPFDSDRANALIAQFRKQHPYV